MILFGVHSTLEYDYICSETYFTPEINRFYPTAKITIPPAACCCSGWTAVQQRRKGHETCIFETPHNEICFLSIKELNFDTNNA